MVWDADPSVEMQDIYYEHHQYMRNYRGLTSLSTMILKILIFQNIVLTNSLDIVHHSEDLIIVKEGKDLDLFCDSSSPYQWCFWSHNG